MTLFNQQPKQVTRYQNVSYPTTLIYTQRFAKQENDDTSKTALQQQQNKPLGWISQQAIYHFIKGPTSKTAINGRFYPQARMATDTYNKVCDLATLDHILSWIISKLGSNVAVSSEIEQLIIKPPATLASWMLLTVQQFRDAGVTISPN